MEEMVIGRSNSKKTVCHQHCSISVLKKLTKKALEKARGIVVGEERIKNMDGQSVLTESVKELQFIVENIIRARKKLRMKTRAGKTKIMRIRTMKA